MQNLAIQLILCVVNCESHRFYVQNLAAMQYCLPKRKCPIVMKKKNTQIHTICTNQHNYKNNWLSERSE